MVGDDGQHRFLISQVGDASYSVVYALVIGPFNVLIILQLLRIRGELGVYHVGQQVVKGVWAMDHHGEDVPWLVCRQVGRSFRQPAMFQVEDLYQGIGVYPARAPGESRVSG